MSDADPTPFTCWEELRPACDEILRRVRQAPLSPEGRAGLATMISVYFFSAAIAYQQYAFYDGRSLSEVARVFADILVSRLDETP